MEATGDFYIQSKPRLRAKGVLFGAYGSDTRTGAQRLLTGCGHGMRVGGTELAACLAWARSAGRPCCRRLSGSVDNQRIGFRRGPCPRPQWDAGAGVGGGCGQEQAG